MGLKEIICGRWGSGQQEFDDIRLDAVTATLMMLGYAHHERHAGSAYEITYSVASLGDETGDIMTLSFTTPDTTKWLHMVFGAKGTAGWRVRFIEAPTGGAETPAGSLDVYNVNRNSSNTSGILDLASAAGKVSYGATLATGGNTLWDEYIEGSTVGLGGSGSVGDRNEVILKQNTTYQLSLYGTDTNPGTLTMDWYEHTNRH